MNLYSIYLKLDCNELKNRQETNKQRNQNSLPCGIAMQSPEALLGLPGNVSSATANAIT
jgi:hypothetical protein